MDVYLLLLIIAFVFLLIILSVSKTRLLFRRACRYFIYDNTVVEFFRNKFLQVVLPGASGLYFLCLDVWGDDWEIIKNHQDKHEFIFSTLIASSLIILLIRGAADWYEGKSDKAYIAFMEQFSVLTSKLVTKKLERFKDEALRLKPNGNTFKQITQPKHQINMILGEIETLLLNHFSVKKSQACITIMHKNPENNTWYFEYETNKGWKHTKAQKLIDEGSAASESLRTGQPVFHACKKSASEKGLYFLSERDKKNGEGSVFCFPAVTKNPDYSDDYIISIVTYGKRLCDPLDAEQAEAISDIFSDVCQRIDLELTLHSIKRWQFEYHTNRTRGGS
jgi:hypothetical protein